MKSILDHRDFCPRRNAVFDRELFPLRLRNCDDPVAHPGEHSLKREIDPHFCRAEIPMKNVTMISVHHDRHTTEPGSSPSQSSSFGCVSVDYVRPFTAKQAHD